MVTIQQLGCWKLLHQHMKQLWGLILLPIYLFHSYVGFFFFDKTCTTEWHIFQGKQRTYWTIEHPYSWIEGTLFPYSVLTIIFHPIHGLLNETTLVILAQPNIHCCNTYLHNCHSPDVRDDVLEPWLKNVSYNCGTKNNIIVQIPSISSRIWINFQHQ